VEALIGSAYADVLGASFAPVTIEGGAGSDSVMAATTPICCPAGTGMMCFMGAAPRAMSSA
jgi:hypothetical protein